METYPKRSRTTKKPLKVGIDIAMKLYKKEIKVKEIADINLRVIRGDYEIKGEDRKRTKLKKAVDVAEPR